MANIIRHISHLKSSGGTAPAAGVLIPGEIAVGYKAGDEALYIENSGGQVVEFKSSSASSKEAKDYTDKKSISKVTGDSEITVTLSDENPTGRTLTVTHASGSQQSGFKNLSTDSYGHVTAGTAVVLSDLTNLGALSGVTGENGISASTKASGNQKIGLSTTGTSGTYTKVNTDAYGRVVSGSATINESDVTNLTTDLAAKVPNTRKVNTASGLTGGGALSADLTIGHSNNITAGTAKTSTTAATVTPTGANVAIPSIVYDANGHITSTSTTTKVIMTGFLFFSRNPPNFAPAALFSVFSAILLTSNIISIYGYEARL